MFGLSSATAECHPGDSPRDRQKTIASLLLKARAVIAHILKAFTREVHVQIDRGFCRAQKEIAIRTQYTAHVFQNLFFGFNREIDHHVAEHDQINGRH
jgi:heme oxygenase